MGEESLGLEWRASVGAKDEYGGPDVSVKGFGWV